MSESTLTPTFLPRWIWALPRWRNRTLMGSMHTGPGERPQWFLEQVWLPVFLRACPRAR